MDQHAIVIADTVGIIRMWNAGATALFGYAAEDAIGRKLDLIVPDKFRVAHWAGFDHAMSTGTARTDGTFFNAPALCSGGETNKFRGQLHILRDESKKAIGAMAIFTSA